jgi:hypothetical protein
MTRFFDFDGQKIPIRKDEATEFYLEGDDGTVSQKPLTTLLGDGSWCVEGAEFSTNHLGTRERYQVVRVEFEIDVHDKRGRYGQLRRRVLVVGLSSEPETQLFGGNHE